MHQYTLIAVALTVLGRYFVEGTFSKNAPRVQWTRAHSSAYVLPKYFPVGRQQVGKAQVKRTRPSDQDFYDFISDGDKRDYRPGDDHYFEFLTGDKKAGPGSGSDLGYWGFINGEDMARKRMQRSVKDKARRTKRSVAGSRKGSKGSVGPLSSSREHSTERRTTGSEGQGAEPRTTYNEFLNDFVKKNDKQDLSWDDFVVGKKNEGARMNFDDFLMGEKRNVHGMVDLDEFVLGKRSNMVDHDEFVLGKRPEMVDHDEFVLGKRPEMVDHDEFVLGKRPKMVDHDEFVLGKRPEMVDHDEFVLGKRPEMVDHEEFVLGKRPETFDHNDFVLGKRQ